MIAAAGRIVYEAGTRLYFTFVKLLAPFNHKAGLYAGGRKNLLQKIATDLANDDRPKAWFHCASLGEFEQARPVMEGLLRNNPELAIVLTFFSPSGYEVRKNYSGAAYIYYLPNDSPAHAGRFLDLVKPAVVVFTKYEFWYHYLHACKNRGIPTFLISAMFRKEQAFFTWYGSFYRNLLHCFTHIFTQDEPSLALLKAHGVSEASRAGDTRFDRVAETAANIRELPLIAAFKNGSKLLVAGSSYAQEETLLANALKKMRFRLIIAPHEVQEGRLKEIEATFAGFKTLRYSAAASAHDLAAYDVLIIDNVGLLASVYAYCEIAFVGGGYGSKGMHNILEAATFGVPVLYGPNNHVKFPEAAQLIAAGGGFSIKDQEALNPLLHELLENEQHRHKAGSNSKAFIRQGVGSTGLILRQIQSRLKINKSV